MGNSSAKTRDRVPTVEVTCCTVHELLVSRMKKHGSKTAQVDASTGETVTFNAVLERAAALAAGLAARGLHPGESALVLGENNVHYPWVVLGVLQSGAAAHLVDPRSTAREVKHALGISRPAVALVSAAVVQQPGVAEALRAAPSVRSILVWGKEAQVQAQVQAQQVEAQAAQARQSDLPDGIASLEQMIVSPAKSASSLPMSPPCDTLKTPTAAVRSGEPGNVTVLTARDVAPGLAASPSAPPPTPTALASSYGDSCSTSASTDASPLQRLLLHAVDGLPQPGQGGSAVAFILQSSGSTGLPKGVMLTHDNVLAALELGPAFIHSDDVVVGLSPYFHAFGGLLMLMALVAGTPVVAIGKFSMETLLDSVEKHQVTVMHMVSSLLVSLGKMSAGELSRLRSVRRIWSGAAQISPLVQSALQSLLPNVRLSHSYGMTETTFTTFCGEVRADKPGSPGKLVRCMECKVVDPDTGKTLPIGARGELCFRGPMVMRGYLGNAEATAEALDADGWLKSGDLGFMDEDGYYYIVERLKDVLKYNGHQVSPSELEALLATHPAVLEAAVVGEPHEYGDAPRALVVLTEGQHATEAELQDFIAGKVAPHKLLRGGVVFMTAPFPRTASGKLQRKKLRALLDRDCLNLSSSSAEAEAQPQPQPEAEPEAASSITPEEHRVVVGLAPLSLESTPQLHPKEKLEFESPSDLDSPLVVDELRRAQGHRPSVVSTTSLSTIYSDSPLTSPGDEPMTPDPMSISFAARVPLPMSKPNSPFDSPAINNGTYTLSSTVLEDSQGSAPMELVSPSSS